MKTARFLALKTTFTAEHLADLYIKEIVRLHGILLTIVSDHDTMFAQLKCQKVNWAWDSTKFERYLYPSPEMHKASTPNLIFSSTYLYP